MSFNQRRFRLCMLLGMLLVLGTVVGLILYALRQNINLYHTPSEIVKGEVTEKTAFRLGGLVVKGSVKRAPDNLAIEFVLSDLNEQVKVEYNGILPDLFREGQGIVALGKLNDKHVFIAQEVLAKHDEKYMPPEVKASLEKTRNKG